MHALKIKGSSAAVMRPPSRRRCCRDRRERERAGPSPPHRRKQRASTFRSGAQGLLGDLGLHGASFPPFCPATEVYGCAAARRARRLRGEEHWWRFRGNSGGSAGGATQSGVADECG